MIDQTTALERIEQAEHETPRCPCGAPTVPVVRGGAVWLVCSNVARWQSRRTYRLLAALFPHVELPVLEAESVA